MPPTSGRDKMSVVRGLIGLARPYRKRLIIITVLALLGTSADLLQPLIYRVAVNDVAGLFVSHAATTRADHSSTPHAQQSSSKQRDEELQRSGATRQKHRRGFVAPRTGRQTLTTLLWAALGLFVISVVGYYLWL